VIYHIGKTPDEIKEKMKKNQSSMNLIELACKEEISKILEEKI